MSRTVLITGARAPVAVDLGRSFAAAGHAVHFADSVPCAAASMSRGATVHRLPAPARQFAAFAEALAELVARIDPVTVVPTCEEIFYVAAAGCDRALAPPLPVLRKLHSKIDFAAHAQSLGIAAPDTWRVGDTLPLEMRPDAMITLRCGDVSLTEGRMGRVGDRVSVRVAKPLRKPKMTYAMFENADDAKNRVEAP